MRRFDCTPPTDSSLWSKINKLKKKKKISAGQLFLSVVQSRCAAQILRGEKLLSGAKKNGSRFYVPSMILREIQVTTNRLLWGRAVISCFTEGLEVCHLILTVPKLTDNCNKIRARACGFQGPAVCHTKAPLIRGIRAQREVVSPPAV